MTAPADGQSRLLVQGLMLRDARRFPEPGWILTRGDRIEEVGEGQPPRGLDVRQECVIGAEAGRILCPGFIDAHTHPPQADCVGCDGMPLLEWLDQVVFPAEMWWGRAGAGHTLRRAVARMAAEGTVGFAGFLTSHGEAGAEALRGLAFGAGLGVRMRALAGRVAMDRGAPRDLIEEDRERVGRSPTTSLVLPDPAGGRVESSANPRFAIACTEELLAECGWLVKERGLCVQTHLAESAPECARIAELFPGDVHYTGVYDRFGLLTERTLLAHCVHLSSAEWELIRERGSVVVHCPTANTFLESGLFDLDAAREHGVRLALGSDVGAGPDFAMPRVGRAMIEVAKQRKATVAPMAHVPTPMEAWSLITEGNAAALGWSEQGSLRAGASADVLVLDVPETWLDERLVGRLIYNWSSRLISKRIVAGDLIDSATIMRAC